MAASEDSTATMFVPYAFSSSCIFAANSFVRSKFRSNTRTSSSFLAASIASNCVAACPPVPINAPIRHSFLASTSKAAPDAAPVRSCVT